MTDERLEQLLTENITLETPDGDFEHCNSCLKIRMAEVYAEERKESEGMNNSENEKLEIKKLGTPKWGIKKLETQKSESKKSKVIKAAGLAAAACLALGAWGVVSTNWIHDRAWSSSEEEYTEFAQLSKAQRKAGMSEADLKAVEGFRNGYRFESVIVIHNEREVESGKSMVKYDSLNIRYRKAGAPELVLTIEPAKYLYSGVEEQEQGADAQKEMEGVKVWYHEHLSKAKIYPADYEVTAEEEEELAREGYSGYMILGHGKEMTEKTWMSYDVLWEQDGLRYWLMSNGNGEVSAEELFAMAEEIIAQ